MAERQSLQNRMTPFSRPQRSPARGLFTGNRGILHNDQRLLVTEKWRHKAWIICSLTHKDWHRTVMTPNRWTELFFLDEATALAAGHRPCALCQRARFGAFARACGIDRAPLIDNELHRYRTTTHFGDRAYPQMTLANVPYGAMVVVAEDKDQPLLHWQGRLWPWSHDGYAKPRPANRAQPVRVLTPPASLAALRNSYRPVIHPSIG